MTMEIFPGPNLIMPGAVVGPSSATDNAVARFDGTTGKLLQGSGVIIDDSNNISGIAAETAVSLALNGATLGGNNLAVTGTGFISGVFSVGGSTTGSDITITQSANTAAGGLRLISTGGQISVMTMQNDNSIVWTIPAGTASLSPTGVWTNSDIDLKENVASLDERYDAKSFDAITPIEFSYIADADSNMALGFSSDEIEAAFPQAVRVSSDGKKQINPTMLIAPMMVVLKKISAALAAAEARIEQLEKAP